MSYDGGLHRRRHLSVRKEDVKRVHQVGAVDAGVAGRRSNLAQHARLAHVDRKRCEVIPYDAVSEVQAKHGCSRVLLSKLGRVDGGTRNHIAWGKEVKDARGAVGRLAQRRGVTSGDVIAALRVEIG